MTKIIFSITFFLLVTTFSLFAQDNLISLGLGDLAAQTHWNNTITPVASDIEGSPYLNEKFEIGEVYYGNKYKINEIPLRYNLYNDEMEYQVKNKIMAFANAHKIDKVLLGDDVFIYLKTRGSEDEVSGYVKLWNEEFPAIITKMSVEFKDKEPQKALVDPLPKRFVRLDNRHFLMLNQQDIVKVKSVKKLIRLLENHQEELTNFAKNEKISSKDPSELAKLLDYYNSL